MARQYFNTTLADSIIASSSVTPTTVETSIFTPFTLGNLAFPIPYGQAAPNAGQVFRFTAGGILTTPATGTMILKPYYGMGTSATSFTGAVLMGASGAQTVPSTALTNAPWRMEGELVFRSISSAATGSTAWLNGNFESQGVLATANSSFSVVFGSTAAVSVDTSGTAAGPNGFGGLTFSVTFSVTGATIVTAYTSMQSLN